MADKLVYFNIHSRGEGIRMMYAVAGKKLTDERLSFANWPPRKSEMPNGQLPVLTTVDGTINQSTTIARYVAKKFGLMGSSLWEEAQHDMVVENINEVTQNDLPKIYGFMLFGIPKPDNADEMKAEVLAKIKQRLQLIQGMAEKREKKYIVSDKVGLADIWLYACLEFSKHAFPDIMEATEWTKGFAKKMQDHPEIKKYLASRPATDMPV